MESTSNSIDDYFNQAQNQFHAGNLNQCADACLQILNLQPGNARVLCLLGVVLCKQRDIVGGIEYFRKAIKADNNVSEFHNNLAKALNSIGSLQEAQASFERAIELDRDNLDACFNLALLMQRQGALNRAIELYRHITKHRPDHAVCWNNLGNIFTQLNQPDQAIKSYRRAISADPGFAEAYSNLAIALSEKELFEESIALQRQAIELKPENPLLRANLGATLQAQGRLDEAIEQYRAVIHLSPRNARGHAHLASALRDRGLLDEALLLFRRSMALKPDQADVHSDFLWTLSLSDRATPREIFEEHLNFDFVHATQLAVDILPHTNLRDPDRRLRIGYVSPDFRRHAVANFITPLLERHDQDSFEIFCYYNYPKSDSATEKIKQYSNHWLNCSEFSDSELAQKIREDGIDILVDLAGHTAHNRCLTFARKPAPVQISWLGYPATTGLKAIDYRLISTHAAKPGMLESQFCEKLIYLPVSAPFEPFAQAPDVNILPALNNGHITFGSFNRPNKLSDSTIALWGRVLAAVPDARMLLGHIDGDGVINTLSARFARHGVSPERLEFHPRLPMADYLSLHHKVDIILDSLPYAGGTTSNHALWMGVPIITLVGERLAQRGGANVLNRVGLEDWVTGCEQDYVDKAINAAKRLDELAILRAGLRERLHASPCRNPLTITRNVESIYRTIWRRWCAGLTPAGYHMDV